MIRSFYHSSFILFIGLLFFGGVSAQSLVISSGGQTGTSGTNWSISSNTLSLSGAATIQASVITNALANGSLTILGSTNALDVTFNEGVVSTVNGSGITIGNSNSTGTVTINRTIDLYGAVSIYANKINMGADLLTPGESAQIITRVATGHISLLAKNGFETLANANCIRGKIMSAGGGNITISANADDNSTGDLNIDWLTIDGTSGTMLFEAAVFTWNTGSQCALPEIYSNAGAFTIRNTASTNYSISSNWFALLGSFTSFTLGRDGGTNAINFDLCTSCATSAINYSSTTFQVSGPITALAGNINVNHDLYASAVGADILLKAFNSIIVDENKTIKTNNGDITFWANSDGTANATDGDFIGLKQGVSLNSANGSTVQSTGGGTITLAGGTSTQTLASGTVVPTGYAYSNRTTNWVVLPPGGVNFGSNTAANGHLNSLTIYSGGGNIVIKGSSNSSSAGVQWFSGSTGAVQIVNSGVGTITFDGLSTSSTAHGIELNSYASVVFPSITSSNTTSNAIYIKGETSSINLRAGYQGTVTLIANGAGGGIEVNGKVGSSSNYSAIEASGLNAYALSGPINFIGDGGLGLKIGGTWGKGTLPSSSSNVTLRSDKFGTYTSTLQTTGTLTVEPFNSSFATALTYPLTNLSVVSGLSGLTVGKSGNTANITLSTAQSIAGPISVYGGNITVNQNYSSTLNSAAILLQSSQTIEIAASKIIQTNGGTITLRSNSTGAALAAASSIILNSGSTLSSQGGNITLGGNFTGLQGAGLYATSSNAPAVLIDGGILTAGGGNIKIYGKCSGSYDDGIRLRGNITTSGSGNVELYGEAHGGNNGTNYFGGITFGTAAGSTIETENGNLILDGYLTNTQSNSTGAINFYRMDGSTGQTNHINLLSKTGNVTVKADRGTTGAYGMGHSSWGHVYVGSPATGWTATGNVVFTYSSLVGAGYNGIKVKTTGSVTYEPVGASFAAAQVLPSNTNYVLAQGASSLTIGKTTNTANIDITSALSIAGPITIYGGLLEIEDDISSTAGADITLSGSNGFYTSGSSAIQRDVTTSGGNILIEADRDANGVGTLNLDYLVVNPGSGNTIIRGEDYNWVTTSEATKPWVNGTGTFTLESNDASIGQNTDLIWFKIDQDANGIAGLNLGKSTNNQAINFNSVGALTINGPVNVNASSMTFSTQLTVNGMLSLYASSTVTQSTPITATSLAMNGAGSFTLTNTSNNFGTVAGGTSSARIGALSLIDVSGGLTIGTIGSTSGIYSSGLVSVETLTGDINLMQPVSTTNTTTSAIVINSGKNAAIDVSEGGNIIVSGSPTISVGTGGIAKLFSGMESNSTGLNTLIGGSSNVRTGYDETSSTFSPVLSANNAYAIYRAVEGAGDITIVASGGHTQGSTWTFSNGVISTLTSPVLINASDVVSKLALSDLSIEGRKITFSTTISSNSANNLKVLAKTHILNTVATSITTQGGDVILSSNVDDATDGESSTNGRIDFRLGGLTITTNGGDITLGGGNTLGTGYALGQSGGAYPEGIRIDVTTNLNSGGGNITIKGKSYNEAIGSGTGGSGLGFYYLTTNGNINSGSGTIFLDGYSQTSGSTFSSGIVFYNNTANLPFTIQSSSNSVDAITINAFSSGTSSDVFGIETEAYSILNLLAPSGGGIKLNTGNSVANYYDIVFRAETNILSAGGPIQVKGGQFGGATNGYLYLNGNLYLGSKSGVVSNSSSNITMSIDRFSYANGTIPKIATSGEVVIESNSTSFGDNTYLSWFELNQNNHTISSFRLGKSNNTSNVYLNSSLTTAGPISAYGAYVGVSGNITSTANGDIFIKGTGGWNDVEVSSAITKTAGTGTLTIQSNGRANFSGAVTATGSALLNVVLWSDYDGDNGDGGATFSGPVSTNGGHVWMGGSNSNGGSYTWNGLTVGDGPSVGGSNANALDFFNSVTTNGGDVFVWAGNGNGGTNGIASNGNWIINTGSGDIALVAPSTSGTIQLTTTGAISLVPNGGAYPAALTLGGTLTSGNYAFNSGYYNGLTINNVSQVTSLTIGRNTELLSAGSPVTLANTSNVTLSTALQFGGAVQLYGGTITLNSNLSTTNTSTGNISLNGTTIAGTGNVAIAAGRTLTMDVSNTSTYDGIISGTGSGFTKAGLGLLTLTKDHTYSGITTVSIGDLQIGTGGSVSQASSGTISQSSGVVVASGAKLILTPNENMTFAVPISGAGGIEIKGASGAYYNSFLTSSYATFATNTTVLEVLTRITGGMQQGQAITGQKTAGAYVKSYNASSNTATLQLQNYDGTYTKCVFVQLAQSGSNVQIKANTSIYGGAAYRSGNQLGSDMSSGSTAIGGLATSAGATGYGISNVYMSGKVNFTGLLTYTGNTLLSNTITSGASPNAFSYTSRGTQEITDISSSFPAASTVINNGLVILNRSTAGTIASNLEGTEEVLQVGAPISLTGTCTHSGLTTVDLNKSLSIGSGGTTGIMTGNILNYGTVTFNRADQSTFPGVISGTGALVKTGAGELILTGLQAFTGTTTISAGKLTIERNVPAYSTSVISGAGELAIQPASASFTNAVSYPIAGIGVSSTIGGLTLGKDGNTATISIEASTSVAGPLNVYAGELALNAAISTTNTSTGDILFKMNTLSGVQSITVADSRSLTFDIAQDLVNGTNIFGSNITLIKDGTGTFTRSSVLPSGISLTTNAGVLELDMSINAQNITLSGGTLRNKAGHTLTLNGTLSSVAGATLENNGTITIVGPSTFPGVNTTVSAMNNLRINKQTGVALDKDLMVTGELNLLLGNFDLGTNTLTLGGSVTLGAGKINASTGVLAFGNQQAPINLPTGLFTTTNGINVVNELYKSAGSASVLIQEDMTVTGALRTASGTGALVFGSATELNMDGDFINNGTLTFDTLATVLQSASSQVSGIGIYNVQQKVTGSTANGQPNGRFWYLGSAVANAQASVVLSPVTNKIYHWEANQANPNWIDVTDPNAVIATGKGYSLRMGATSVLNFGGPALNNSNIQVPCYRQTTGSYQGYNLIANPYLSYLDWETVWEGSNALNFQPTIWYRLANNTNVMVFDTYNAQSNIGTSNNSANGSTSVSRYIPPMQAVWMRLNPGITSANLVLDNTARSHYTAVQGGLTAGLKSTAQDFPAFVRLNLIQGSFQDQTIVYLKDAAASSYDAFDSDKMFLTGYPQVYSQVAGKKLVINGLKDNKKVTVVPLFIDIPTTGNYTFKASELNIENGLILLEDKQEGVLQDLTVNDTYQFAAASGTISNRFYLRIILPNNQPIAQGPVSTWVNEEVPFTEGGNILVSSDGAGKVIVSQQVSDLEEGFVLVRDAAGRLVFEGLVSGEQTIFTLEQPSGLYFVEVQIGNTNQVEKILLR